MNIRKFVAPTTREAMKEIRSQTKDLTSGIAQQARGISAVAGDTGSIAEQIARLRAANSQQAKDAASVLAALTGSGRAAGNA